jgi:hypothetical protein
MDTAIRGVSIVVLFSLFGCAHIDFGGDGLTYYDPKPYLFVSTTHECVTTATVVVIPERKKSMKFNSGYGSSELSASLTNGMISSVGQKSDTKIPETLNAIANVGSMARGLRETDTEVICKPAATLYPLDSGTPNLATPLSFNIEKIERK